MSMSISKKIEKAVKNSQLGKIYKSKIKKQKSYASAINDEHVADHLKKVEKDTHLSSMNDGFKALRPLGLEDFGNILWNMPSGDYPKLSKILPAMAPDQVSIQWTGAAGTRLFEQSIGFVRSCAENYASITGNSLRGKRILDFGCGYGRFLRLFSYYTDDVFGVDAWEKSLDHSRAAGFGEKVRRSAEVPEQLPFDEKFDFLFSFSVFTHLSETATIASLKALRKAAKDGAVLVITIRPVEFWTSVATGKSYLDASKFNLGKILEKHRQNGFAFYVEDTPDPMNEGLHYGDTSISLDWLLANIVGWKFEGVDRSLDDRQQRYVFLRAV